MPHRLIPAGSPWANDDDAVRNAKEFCVSHINFLAHTWNKIPVYLIDEDLMDHVYPPQRRILLNEECVQRFLKEFFLDRDLNVEILMREIERLFERLQAECMKGIAEFVACGVYWHKEYYQLPVDGFEFPCIFICPERVWGAVARLLGPPNSISMKMITARHILFATVLFHELGHAFMATDRITGKPTDKFWTRIVEESLANILAWNQFNVHEKRIVNPAMLSQAMEYRGFTFWQEYSKPRVRSLARAWSAFHTNRFLIDDIFPQVDASGQQYNRNAYDFYKDSFMKNPNDFWKLVSVMILSEVCGF